jgi:hypothetical protein
MYLSHIKVAFEYISIDRDPSPCLIDIGWIERGSEKPPRTSHSSWRMRETRRRYSIVDKERLWHKPCFYSNKLISNILISCINDFNLVWAEQRRNVIVYKLTRIFKLGYLTGWSIASKLDIISSNDKTSIELSWLFLTHDWYRVVIFFYF